MLLAGCLLGFAAGCAFDLLWFGRVAHWKCSPIAIAALAALVIVEVAFLLRSYMFYRREFPPQQRPSTRGPRWRRG